MKPSRAVLRLYSYMLKPISKKKWDFTMAAHLLNRAGFGGTPGEIEHLKDLGLQEAVASLVDYEKVPDNTPAPEWAKPDPDRVEKFMEIRKADPARRQELAREAQRKQQREIVELKYWWLRRMAKGPRPLQEKMTLFWHGHFATSMEKVRDAYLMWKQNELFRQQSTGNWLEMLITVAKDPAMLIWLDQAQSRKEHPNENFAREVMELFALGEGHYTEKDITEAARALTGWTYDRINQQFEERLRMHDDGIKTVLGKTGDLNGADVLEQIVGQPQAARFITAKIWNFFAGQMPSEELNSALADVFRKSENNFKPVLKMMFLSEEFYSESIVRNQVKSPVQWLVGSVRVLERELPPPFVCFGLTKNLGQDLFQPPNVKGWDGGLSWITTNNLLARYNEAAVLVQGDLSMARGINLGPKTNAGAGKAMMDRVANMRLRPVDTEQLLSEAERSDKEKLVAALEKRLLQSKLRGKQEQTLKEYLSGQTTVNEDVIRNTIRLIMSTPEFQLT